MPCGHSFCFNCLQSLTNKACPVCRKEFSKLDITELPKNYALSQVTPTPNRLRPQCANAGEKLSNCSKLGDYFCKNCRVFFCESCLEAEHSTKVLKRHEVVKDFNEFDYCADHDFQKVQMYCEPCRVLVCPTCSMTRHRDSSKHIFKEISEAAKTNMESFNSSLNSLQKQHDETNTKVDEVTKELQNLIEKRDRLAQTVQLLTEFKESPDTKFLANLQKLFQDLKLPLAEPPSQPLPLPINFFGEYNSSWIQLVSPQIVKCINNARCPVYAHYTTDQVKSVSFRVKNGYFQQKPNSPTCYVMLGMVDDDQPRNTSDSGLHNKQGQSYFWYLYGSIYDDVQRGRSEGNIKMLVEEEEYELTFNPSSKTMTLKIVRTGYTSSIQVPFQRGRYCFLLCYPGDEIQILSCRT